MAAALDVLFDAEHYKVCHDGHTNSEWWAEIMTAREELAELVTAAKEYIAAGSVIDQSIYNRFLLAVAQVSRR